MEINDQNNFEEMKMKKFKNKKREMFRNGLQFFNKAQYNYADNPEAQDTMFSEYLITDFLNKIRLKLDILPFPKTSVFPIFEPAFLDLLTPCYWKKLAIHVK